MTCCLLHQCMSTFYGNFITDNIRRTVKIETSTVEIEERGVKLRLTVVDTPGYGDGMDNKDRSDFLKALLSPQGAYLISGPIREGAGGGGLFQIMFLMQFTIIWNTTR